MKSVVHLFSYVVKSLAGCSSSLLTKLSVKCRILLASTVPQVEVFQGRRDCTEDSSCCNGTSLCVPVILP
jgi:hypothetical protein